jgi:hypothetical protein
MTTLVVIAKECLPGKVKTRLHPPLTLEQAAEVAAASLGDTLLATDSLPASRRILLFDGNRPPVGSEQFDVIPQTTGPLDERIAALFDLVTGPTVLIGMDTPQLVRDDLAPAFDGEWPDDVDAWYGASTDGGFWALGLRDPDGSLVRGVPMSRDDTGAHQLARLRHRARLHQLVLALLLALLLGGHQSSALVCTSGCGGASYSSPPAHARAPGAL